MGRKPSYTRSQEIQKAVLAYFTVYRECVQQLSGGGYDAPEPDTPKRGYEFAVNPKAIRDPRRRAYSTVERALLYDQTEEERLAAFCDKLNRALRKLPKYERELIRKRYLVPLAQELPTDRDVWRSLRRDGWKIDENYFSERKQESIDFLAEELGLDKMLAEYRPRTSHINSEEATRRLGERP